MYQVMENLIACAKKKEEAASYLKMQTYNNLKFKIPAATYSPMQCGPGPTFDRSAWMDLTILYLYLYTYTYILILIIFLNAYAVRSSPHL